MSAVLLEATRQGLGNCPLSQPLEVGSTRETLQNDVLGGTLSPQVVLRIGWAQEDPLPPTPRRPVEEIIEATNREVRLPFGAAGSRSGRVTATKGRPTEPYR